MYTPPRLYRISRLSRHHLMQRDAHFKMSRAWWHYAEGVVAIMCALCLEHYVCVLSAGLEAALFEQSIHQSDALVFF